MAAQRLGSLLDEADEFCRFGDLLTLATVAESVACRRWFVDEFVLQVSGWPPRSWSALMEGRARAHRTAFAALKHSFEKVGDQRDEGAEPSVVSTWSATPARRSTSGPRRWG